MTIGLLWSFHSLSFSEAKADFSSEIAADFDGEENEDHGDKELKFSNLHKDVGPLSTHHIKIFPADKNFPRTDFFSTVPTSPPNA